MGIISNNLRIPRPQDLHSTADLQDPPNATSSFKKPKVIVSFRDTNSALNSQWSPWNQNFLTIDLTQMSQFPDTNSPQLNSTKNTLF